MLINLMDQWPITNSFLTHIYKIFNIHILHVFEAVRQKFLSQIIQTVEFTNVFSRQFFLLYSIMVVAQWSLI